MTSIRDDRGATAVEYALFVGFVSVAMFFGIAALNAALGATFTAVADEVAGGSGDEVVSASTAPSPESSTAPSPESGTAPSPESGTGGDEVAPTPAPADEPGEPSSVRASSSARGELEVTWAAPTDDGGSAILGYEVQIDDRDGKSSCARNFKATESQKVLGTSATFGDLSGSDYCMRIRAINAEGSGDWAEGGLASVMEMTEPGEPADVTATSEAPGEFVVAWTAPASDGGSAILGYEVEIDDRSGEDRCSGRFDASDDEFAQDTSAAFSSVTGTAYCVRVRSVSAEGESDWVEAGVVSLAGGTASAPRNLEETSETKVSVILDWDAPSIDGGSDITDYVVEYRVHGQTTWLTFDDQVRTATSASVTGLKKDTEYDFRVAAVTAAGPGAFSEIFTHSTDD